MLSYQNIRTIATYERKTLYRTWFFKIFAIIALLGLAIFHLVTNLDSGADEWAFRALPANIPYTNIKFLNIIQSIIAIFLASGFLKKDKKLDTSIVIYVRPMSNAEYVFGKTLGVLQLFLGLNVVSLTFAYIMSIVSLGSLPDIIPFFVYPMLISVPSLIYIFGLSFVTMSFTKNQSITFILLLGYIGTCVFYLGASINPIFDYTSFNLPLLYSDITGFSNLADVLLHRGAYMLMGLAFIILTTIKIDRLPNAPFKIKRYIIVALILFLCGSYCLEKIWSNDRDLFEKKALIAKINNEYYDKENIDILRNDISLTHNAETITCESKLRIKNNNAEAINTFIISLNPGLIIESIKENNKELKYIRKENIIEISDKIEQGEEKIIDIKYTGNIDERACYTDITEKKIKEKINFYSLNIPKKYAFLESDYVLLTSEANWYPTAGLSYNPLKAGIGRYMFSHFTLKVKTRKGLTALSQGETRVLKDGTFSFVPAKALTQISLMIGEYQKQEIKIDSITYSIHFKKGHDYYTPVFEEIRDTLPSVIKGMMSDYELKQKRNYPYKRLTLVETPAQFCTYARLWTSHRECVQPEMVFLPELGLTLPNADFADRFKGMKKWRKRDDESIKDKDLKAEMFNSNMYSILLTDETSNKPDWGETDGIFESSEMDTKIYSIYPNFYTFTNNIKSDAYPIIGGIVENLTKDEAQARGGWWMTMLGGITTQEKANLVLNNNKLEHILEHTADYSDELQSIMQNKTDFFKALITNKIGKEKLRGVLTKFYNNNMYKRVELKELLDYLHEQYELDIDSQLKQWYLSDKMPGYRIEDIDGYTVLDGDEQKYQLIIKISNLEPVDGIISLRISLQGNGGRRQPRAKRQADALEYSYFMKGNTSYEIGIVTSKRPVVFSVNTIVSKNIPAKITKRFENFNESDKKAFDGVRELTISNDKNIIIVDNEDKNFELKQDIKEKKLKKFIASYKKEAKEKYKSMSPWNPPSRWTLFSKEGQYGKYIRSAYYARSNEMNKKAVWNADIKKEGYYEVYFFYNSDIWTYNKQSNKQNTQTIYNLSVIADGETNNIELNLDRDSDKGWFSLGSYYFPAGKASVELSDKSGSRSIIADAVKWVRKE